MSFVCGHLHERKKVNNFFRQASSSKRKGKKRALPSSLLTAVGYNQTNTQDTTKHVRGRKIRSKRAFFVQQ